MVSQARAAIADLDWPDWRDSAVAIVASGPSIKKADVASLRGRLPVIAIKENHELAPWADIVYGCDAAWWRNVQGLPGYGGIKVSATARTIADAWPDIRIITVLPSDDNIQFGPAFTVGSGGNSGFQALNLAVQLGARRVLLLGFDADDRSGTHWFGRANGLGRSNPGEFNFRRWRAAFANCAKPLAIAGVEVVNASPISSLKAFPKIAVEAALKRWGL